MDTGFLDADGNDVSTGLVPKSYLLDRYPQLSSTYRSPGLYFVGDTNYNGNNFGQSGTGSDGAFSSPVLISASSTWKTLIDANRQVNGLTMGAIKTDGTLWMWGYNEYGQLGTNNRTTYNSPVQTVSTATTWKQVSTCVGTTAAIKTDGTLWTWGYNAYGQLGNNSILSRSSPGLTVAGGTTWRQISLSQQHAAAIKTDGTLWTWGINDVGQLGTGNYTYRSSPGQIAGGGTTWRQVSGCAAIKTDGTLWLWGANDGRTYLTPVQVSGGGTNWKQVADTGYAFSDSQCTAAIKTDGTLWCWGSNRFGQLGDGTLTTRWTEPAQTVVGGTDWHSIKFISSPFVSIVAMKTDGSLWRWGWSDYSSKIFPVSSLYITSPTKQDTGDYWMDIAGDPAHYSAILLKDTNEDLL